MGLDFNNTCPMIDDNMERTKRDIEYYFDEMLNDIQGQLPDGIEIEIKIKDYTERLYKDLAYYFEELRTVNSDMRTQAEKQIDELEIKIDDLERALEQVV